MSPEQGIITESLASQLAKFIRRIEALEEEKSAIAMAMKEVFEDAKGEGVDVKALKELLKLRKMDQGERQEQQSTLQQYLQALGMSRN
jgi:uncharacterized protein (UPF0335 family)